MCEEGKCLLTGNLKIKSNIKQYESNFGTDAKFQNAILTVLLIDQVTFAKNNYFKDYKCNSIKQKSNYAIQVIIDGRFFSSNNIYNKKPTIYYVYIVDCEQLLKDMNYPDVSYEIDFVNTYKTFTTAFEEESIEDYEQLPVSSKIHLKKQILLKGYSHLGYDQKFLPYLFMISFIIISIMNIYQFFTVYNEMVQGMTRWHIVWVNLATFLLGGFCILNWIHLHFYYYDGYGIPFINWFGDLLEILADIIITTMLLCMATGWLFKSGTKIESDLVTPLAIFAALFNMLIFSIDFITDTDFKFFTFDSWVGYIVCILRLVMGLIFYMLYTGTFKSKTKNDLQMDKMQQYVISQLQFCGLCYFFHWPIGFVCITIYSKVFPMSALNLWYFFRVILNFAVVYFMNYSFNYNRYIKKVVNDTDMLGSFE